MITEDQIGDYIGVNVEMPQCHVELYVVEIEIGSDTNKCQVFVEDGELEVDGWLYEQVHQSRVDEIVKDKVNEFRLLNDFDTWSGGFSPEECSSEQIECYLDYALLGGINRQFASETLNGE